MFADHNMKGLAYPAHSHSLTRTFAVNWCVLQCQIIWCADSKGFDQTTNVRKLPFNLEVHFDTKNLVFVFLLHIEFI